MTVPVYPEEGDDVKVLGRGGQIWFGRIVSSDTENRKSNLKWFIETRSGIYTLSSQEDVVAWKSVLGFAHIRRAMGGYRIDNWFVISLLKAFITTSTCWIWQLL